MRLRCLGSPGLGSIGLLDRLGSGVDDGVPSPGRGMEASSAASAAAQASRSTTLPCRMVAASVNATGCPRSRSATRFASKTESAGTIKRSRSESGTLHASAFGPPRAYSIQPDEPTTFTARAPARARTPRPRHAGSRAHPRWAAPAPTRCTLNHERVELLARPDVEAVPDVLREHDLVRARHHHTRHDSLLPLQPVDRAATG